MRLWTEALSQIKTMEVIKYNNMYSILINGDYLIREFNKEEPYCLKNYKDCEDLMNDYQQGIEAFRLSLKIKKQLS